MEHPQNQGRAKVTYPESYREGLVFLNRLSVMCLIFNRIAI